MRRYALHAPSVLCSMILAAVAGCGGRASVETDAGVKTDGLYLGGVGTMGIGAGGACTTTVACASGLVCDPKKGQCSPQVACAKHSDCGAAAFCDNGRCARSQPGSPCDTAMSCPIGQACTSGRCGCGGALYQAKNVPANLLIVLDRSGSMNEEIARGMTKWQVAKSAIANFLGTHGDRLRFGLMLFPGTDQSCQMGQECGAGRVFVDVGDMKGAAINTFLASSGTCSFSTPIGATLAALAGYQGLTDPMYANYVVLVTDGKDNCRGADPDGAAMALRRQMPEVKTFVVGFGSGVDRQQLRDLAMAGGTARMAMPVYYQADDPASLMSAFESNGGSVVSCSYTLSEIPPDPNQLYVYMGKTQVVRDPSHANGWDYEAGRKQLTFYGAACDLLRAAKNDQLTISYGCPRAVNE